MVQPYGPRDDLQRLEGVDPLLEKTLNRLGIYHYHQIARFDPSDVEWLVEHVEGVPANTIRDSWIADAGRLSGVQPGN
jgi:predicted flap endonuclease-1-like 5' DNA nuclease